MKKRSLFDLSYTNLFTASMGKLYPFYREEVVPNDTFKVSTQFLCRFLPQLVPFYSNIKVRTHYFFVPYRLLWSNWENFITRGIDGLDNSVPPYMIYNSSTMGERSLADYMGLPNNVASGQHISALPFRAYEKIYNDWFINRNIQSENTVNMADGQDSTTNLNLYNVNWAKDLFTSSFTSTQKGQSASIPLTGDASVSVYGNGKGLGLVGMSSNGNFGIGDNASSSIVVTSNSDLAVGSTVTSKSIGQSGSHHVIGVNSNPSLSGLTGVADMSNVDAVEIIELRRASALQRFMEKLNLGGNRYVEFLRNFFGANNGDLRLQRSQYLGGGTTPILTSEVLQTSSSTQDSSLGNMAGHSFAVNDKFNGFKHRFTEFGIVLGVLSIIPDTAYFQGLPKMFSKDTFDDYLIPDFQHIGEVAIKNKEVYANSSNPDGNFGFQRRYYDYTDHLNEVHGQFRSSLKYWHTARDFENEPTLNEEFIKSNPTTRIFSSESEQDDQILFDLHNACYVKRCLDYKEKIYLK